MSLLSIKITNLMAMNSIDNEAQFCQQLGVSQTAFDSLISGNLTHASQSILHKIADFFDVSVDHLLIEDPQNHIFIPENERYHDSPSAVLRYLMKDVGDISEGELFRRTGVPQPTIHRILSGKTPRPRMDSVQPLAEFFNVTPDQLLGRVPLPADRIPGSFTSVNSARKLVPILTWQEAIEWPEILSDKGFKLSRTWLSAESEIKGSAFALRINDSDCLPEFREGTTIIIDFSRLPKDGDFVLSKVLSDNKLILGQLSVTKQQSIVIPLSLVCEDLRVGANIELFGVVAEAKHRF